jgi:hypothetical protein
MAHSGDSLKDAALFIDWENFKISLWNIGKQPNLSALMEAVKSYGRIVIARAYADWEDPIFLNQQDPSHLYAAGIEPVFVPGKRYSNLGERRKNSVDVKMSTDCITICHSHPNIATFILVSGDADFLHVSNALRPLGKRVIMIGVSHTTSTRISDRVDDLLLYDRDVDPEALPISADPKAEAAQQARKMEPILELLERLVREQRELGDYPLISWLANEVQKRVPGFHPRNYGCQKFKELVERAEQLGRVKIATSGLRDWVLLPDEEMPEQIDGVSMLLPEAVPVGGSGEEAEEDPHSEDSNPLEGVEDPFDQYRAVFEDIIITAYECERHPGYHYVAPGLIRHVLSRKAEAANGGPPIPFWAHPCSDQTRSLNPFTRATLVNYAIQAGLFSVTPRRDPTTSRHVTDLRLNMDHPLVQQTIETIWVKRDTPS